MMYRGRNWLTHTRATRSIGIVWDLIVEDMDLKVWKNGFLVDASAELACDTLIITPVGEPHTLTRNGR